MNAIFLSKTVYTKRLAIFIRLNMTKDAVGRFLGLVTHKKNNFLSSEIPL